MKLISDRPLADPETAGRKMLQIANAVEPVQDGRIHIEKINWPFLSDPAIRGTPSEYKAGLDFAVAKGWLWVHESGTYVKITEAGAVLFA
jgi:hypothetical protein